jgi:hypothetical protein
MRKFNFTMALRWFIYFPLILPLCVVFGALQGMYTMANKVLERMRLDIRNVG